MGTAAVRSANQRRLALSLAVALAASGCANSYDIPAPTMVGNQRAYSMMGFVSTTDEAKVRAKVLRIVGYACHGDAQLAQFRTEPADSAFVEILRYEAVATCVGK